MYWSVLSHRICVMECLHPSHEPCHSECPLLWFVVGPQAAPSLLLEMSAAEFVQRLQPSSRLPNLVYMPQEQYYWQAELPAQLQHLQEIKHLLNTLAGSTGGASAPSGAQQQQQELQQQLQQQLRIGSAALDASVQSGNGLQQPEQLVLTQQPRLWVSPAGAVSPLHYDKSHSFLVQVAGTKRMLFFSPDQLHRLYCYADTHLLRRRSRVNVSAPDLTKFPLFADVAALEVVLQPGDIVCFPSFWSHYTESLEQQQLASGGGVVKSAGCSMSITFRCQAAA